MARRRTAVPSRRRALQEDEGEDDILAAEESLTDDSLTEDDDDEDKDEGQTDLSDEEDDEDIVEKEIVDGTKKLSLDKQQQTPVAVIPAGNGNTKPGGPKKHAGVNGIVKTTTSAETGGVESEEAKAAVEESGAGKHGHGVHKQTEETPLQRRRREHEAYKKQRDADPAFVPNRGRFFMHDHRHGRGGSNGFRPFGRGFIRRGGAAGQGFNRDSREPTLPATDRWKHDMHDEVVEDEKAQAQQAQMQVQTQTQVQPQDDGTFRQNKFREQTEYVRSFGRTYLKGTVQIIVNIPGMKSPITFSEVPYRVYTRLPLHRPPLRRDKPVRIALADAPIRYIYPSVHRSFVFIPRNMRPNQQHSISHRGGGSLGPRPRSFVGPIQRTAANDSPAASRRNSAYMEKPQPPTEEPKEQDAPMETEAPVPDADIEMQEDTKPVVKLPPATPANAPEEQQTQEQSSMDSEDNKVSVTVKLPPVSSYPTPPAQPIQAVRPTSTIPMHQPRPQKAVSVAEIENPASLPPNYPHHPNGPQFLTYSRTTPFHPQSNEQQHPQQPLPESAVHAPPFQPSFIYHTPFFYPGQMISPPAPPPLDAYGNVAPMPPPPPFVPSPFNVSAPPFAPVSAPPPPATLPTSSGGAIAQESNGTVYFYEPSHYYAATYGAPFPMIGMPMPMTPAPDGMQGMPGVEGMPEGMPPAGATMMNGMYYFQPQPIPAGQGMYYG